MAAVFFCLPVFCSGFHVRGEGIHSTVKTFPGGMVWGWGWGWGYVHMVSGAKLKYTKLMGFCETAMDEGEGMGPVGCGEEGKRKNEEEEEAEAEEG